MLCAPLLLSGRKPEGTAAVATAQATHIIMSYPPSIAPLSPLGTGGQGVAPSTARICFVSPSVAQDIGANTSPVYRFLAPNGTAAESAHQVSHPHPLLSLIDIAKDRLRQWQRY